MIFFRTYAGTFLGILFLMGCGGSASAQVSVSIYGGHEMTDGPAWLGHSPSTTMFRTDAIDQFIEKNYGGLYGASIRFNNLEAPLFRGFEFYFEGLDTKQRNENANAFIFLKHIQGDAIAFIGTAPQALTQFEQKRYEFGLRGYLPGSVSGMDLFVVPFFGIAKDEIRTTTWNSVNTSFRRSRMHWQYAGIEFGAERAFRLTQAFSFIAGGSIGTYWAGVDADFLSLGVTGGGELSQVQNKVGLRAQGKLELKTQWTELLSTSLLGQAIFWSDVPYSDFATNRDFGPPVGMGFDQMTEFRVLLKLTANLGALR